MFQTQSSLTSQSPELPKSSEALSDASVAHGLSFANSFPSDLEGRPLVVGHALIISAQIRLHLLPHFLLGVQVFIRLTWIRQQRDKQVSSCRWNMRYTVVKTREGVDSKSWLFSNDLEHAREVIFLARYLDPEATWMSKSRVKTRTGFYTSKNVQGSVFAHYPVQCWHSSPRAVKLSSN